MEKEKFKEMSKEMIPLFDKIMEIGKKYGLSEGKLSRFVFDTDGYFDFSSGGVKYEVYRTRLDGKVSVRLPEEEL